MKFWYSHLIGKPWQAYATGPDAFDCWGLVFHVYAEHYGLNSVNRHLNIETKNPREFHRAYEIEKSRGGWIELNYPQEGALVLMSERLCFHHCGVFTGGTVLHARDGYNVCTDTLLQLGGGGVKRMEFWLPEELQA